MLNAILCLLSLHKFTTVINSVIQPLEEFICGGATVTSKSYAGVISPISIITSANILVLVTNDYGMRQSYTCLHYQETIEDPKTQIEKAGYLQEFALKIRAVSFQKGPQHVSNKD